MNVVEPPSAVDLAFDPLRFEPPADSMRFGAPPTMAMEQPGGGFDPRMQQGPMMANGPSFAPPDQQAGVPYGQPMAIGKAKPVKLYAALLLAILAVGSLLAYATYLLLSDPHSDGEQAQDRLPDDVQELILRGSPPDLAKADGDLRKLEKSRDRSVVLARLQHRVLRATEVSGSADGLDDAIQTARKDGLSADDVAFADLAAAVLAGDAPRAEAIVAAQGSSRDEDALFLLIHGIWLERQGALAAQDRYALAVKVQPRLLPATIRLARLLVLEGTPDEARAEIERIAKDHPARKALEALAWARGRIRGSTLEPPELNLTSADLPRPLHPVFTALAILKTPPARKRTESDPQLAQAVNDADSPAFCVLLGDIALLRDDDTAALAAARRGLALAPEHRPSVELLERIALRSTRFEQLEAILVSMSADSARPIRAAVAYERAQLDVLTTLASGLSDADDAGGLVRTRLALLRGVTPVPLEALEKLHKADPVAGELGLVDGLLDVGDLTRAKALIEAWPDKKTSPSRALRYAKLLRHQGQAGEAVRVLDAALPLQPTQIERILADAELEPNRDHALSLIRGGVGDAGPFLEAYVLAKKRDQARAGRKLDGLRTPFDAPLAVRIAAALAYSEAEDTSRGEQLVRLLYERYPKNADVYRAAKKMGIALD
jgi:hypothetical protein